MIDNFEKIESLLNFEGVYQLQILQRSKDGHDKSSRMILEWFITSENQFRFLQPAIELVCNEYSARAYINLNPRSPEAILYKTLELGIEKVKNKDYTPLNLTSSAAGKLSGHSRKIWIIDVDNREYDLDLICSRIEQCQSGYVKNVINILPTVNGFHILTCPFNLMEFQRDEFPEISIHKNNPTLLYAP